MPENSVRKKTGKMGLAYYAYGNVDKKTKKFTEILQR